MDNDDDYRGCGSPFLLIYFMLVVIAAGVLIVWIARRS